MLILQYTYCFYKQLGSEGFLGLTFLNGCLVVWRSNLCEEYSSFQNSKPILMISNFKIFLTMLLRQVNFGPLNSYFTFMTKEKLRFSLICCFYCCLRGLSPEICLAICHPRANRLWTGCLWKNNSVYTYFTTQME